MKKYTIYGLFAITILFPIAIVGILISQWNEPTLIDYSEYINTTGYKFTVEKLSDRTFSKYFSDEINSDSNIKEFIVKTEKYLTGTVRYQLLEYNYTQALDDETSERYVSMVLKGIRNDSTSYLVKITLRELEDDEISIVGIHFDDFNSNFEEQISLSLQPFTAMHIVALSISLIVSLLVMTSAYFIAFKNPPERQLLWMVLNMFSITKLFFNWFTASFSYQLIYLSFVGVSFSKNGNTGPWILGASVPIFSIIYLIRVYNKKSMKIVSSKEHSD
ncbi:MULTISPECIES: hypothetical protein [unclassified Leptospira]|uniref:hypothetical protein n=1 Tax=unclassified Leptospira TaxID=2633828 RepID=UPI0002BD4270|nr:MULTISPECIES: hypothetical protein [unclassified Leptospira]EMJ97709.1 hypothetical protein LEP1GSC192_3042 [Leptospira sp. B5-022]MCR1795751.1 hypothetical protein [Leptospira sp. id769339]